MTRRRVAVCESVVDAHVFEVPSHVSLEEPFYLLVVELRIYEDRSDIRFYDVRKALRGTLASCPQADSSGAITLGGFFVVVQ